jgi:hypothetical protein
MLRSKNDENGDGMPKRKTHMTLEQIAAKIIADINKMTPDEKAHIRAKLDREFSTVPAEKKITYKM